MVGRNREGNGESGSAQVEERWCEKKNKEKDETEEKKAKEEKDKKEEKDRDSWVCQEKGSFVLFCYFFYLKQETVFSWEGIDGRCCESEGNRN